MAERKKILIVDDDPSARYTLEALLYSEGYDLFFAASGEEAIGKLDEIAPDTILLDVMMPGLDGFEVCRVLKSSERWQHTPIILVTALDGDVDLARGIDAGADDFLSKPARRLELQARVRSMLRIKAWYEEQEAALRMRETLSQMIVHDMRTHLSVILGLSGLLALDVSEPSFLQYLKTIEFHATQLNSFANDLLVQAKLEGGKLALNRSPVDVNQLVRRIEETHSVVARVHKIDLVAELPEQSRQVWLDANLFQRVLDNLVSNALKFSPPGGRVILRVAYPEGDLEPSVRIHVLDEGPGIPVEHRDRVFEKFEIIRLKSKNVPQLGLGLAFCKLAVEAHGGQISVQDNEPEGTVFTVEI